jgi:hypothetical protein
MRDETGRLDVIGVGEDKLFILRRPGYLFAVVRRLERRSTSAIAIALRSLMPKVRP